MILESEFEKGSYRMSIVSPDKKTAILEQRVVLLQQELSELKDREKLK